MAQYTPKWVTFEPVPRSASPVLIALIDDYDVVVTGVARMLDPYRDRVLVAEIDTNEPLHDTVDVALYDSFAQPESDHDHVDVLAGQPARGTGGHLHLELPSRPGRGGEAPRRARLPVQDPAGARAGRGIERVAAGQVVVSEQPRRARAGLGLNWPGRDEGLTDREAEILALITQGKSNSEVAELTFLSANTVKSYIRNLYRKIGVSSRTQAALWGVNNGFLPDHRRIDHWRGGP